VIAITLGDPAGVGPEVVFKALARRKQFCFPLILLGLRETIEKQRLQYPKLRIIPIQNAKESLDAGVYFLDCGREAEKMLSENFSAQPLVIEAGKLSAAGGAAAFAAIERAAKLAADGRVRAVVTAPISKSAVRMIQPGFIGHTEYFAAESGVTHYAMGFVSSKLVVTLVTIHVPLCEVSGMISQELVLEKIRLTHDFLTRRLGKSQPRIAVCALNPHGAETGPEENAVILPAVELAKQSGMNACGPLPGDQVFYDAYEGRFDAVVSMYHDQGLGPFKMVSFHDGVNITLGLPYIRTSPDHGTAFNIAGHNTADPRSFESALQLAETLLQNQTC